MTLYFIVCLLLAPMVMVKGGDWDYLKQENWSNIFPNCGGLHQSPIDLQDVCLPGSQTVVNSSMRLVLVNYESSDPLEYSFTNNGHTAELTLAKSDTYLPSAPKITGSAADGKTYQFTQLHFHWDQVSRSSEFHSKYNLSILLAP